MTVGISVLLVTFNHARYIERALASISAQATSSPIEVVVADDSSTDDTRELVSRWAEQMPFPVRILEGDERLGITRNYARGFAACRGEFIAVLEGDDEWIASDKLERQATALRDNPSLSMSANRILLFDEDSGHSRIIPMIGNDAFLTEIADRELADTNWFATFSACMYRTSALRQLSPEVFETTAYDWLINMAMMAHGNAAFLPEVMTLYRQHSGGEWSHKKQVDRDRQLQELIPTYISLLGPRVARELARTGQLVEQRLRHSIAVVDAVEPQLFTGLGYPLPIPRYERPQAPLVSVVMTCYNHAPYILEAVNSVLDQTVDDLELVIVDDGSVDGSMAALAVVDDPRVRVYQLGANQGAAAALNIAIQQTRGRLVAVINSDDAWEPRKLERQLEVFAETPGLGAVFTSVRLIGEDGRPLAPSDLPPWNGVFRQRNRSQGAWLRTFFEGGNVLCHPSVLIRREFYERHGLYDNRMRQIPDLQMWATLVKHYPIHVLGDEELVRFRLLRGEANASSTSQANVVRGVREHLDLNERFFADCPDEVLRDGFGDVLRDPLFVTADERACAVALLWLDVECAMHGVNRIQGLRELRALLGVSTTRTLLLTRYAITDVVLHDLARHPDDLPAAELARWLLADGAPVATSEQIDRLPSGMLLATILRRARASSPLAWPQRAAIGLRIARENSRRAR